MLEIKPCHFCGGNAKAIHNTEDGTDKVLIECENCFAETNYYQLELSAILHWNKREQHCTQCEIGQQNLNLIAENDRLKDENEKYLTKLKSKYVECNKKECGGDVGASLYCEHYKKHEAGYRCLNGCCSCTEVTK